MRSIILLVCLFVLAAYCKVFDRCELVKVLKTYGVEEKYLATMVCIAFQESSYHTSKHGKPNKNGSRDNGLFQINDKYWCTNQGKGHECNVNCASLRDNDIADDIACAKLIIRKQGFKAWSTYSRCTNPSSYLKGCH